MGNSWRDRDFHHREEGISFPFIQVVHQPGQIDPRPERGGLFQPAKEAEVAGANIPGVAAKFHCGGGPIEGAFAPSLEIAVLKTREMLVAGRGDKQRRVAEFGPGVHSKVQAACLFRSEDGNPIGPVMLTVKSTVAKAFWSALRDHRSDVRAATGGKAPAYAFYWRFGATGTEQTDEGGTVTSFGRIQEGAFDPDAAYVGDGALDSLDWEELEAWAEAWNGNGHSKSHSGGSAPSGSASADQWETITTLLDDVGYVTEETQAAAIVGAGYDPTSLSTQDAEALIERLEVYKKQQAEAKKATAAK
jgi:hypothetical protein